MNKISGLEKMLEVPRNLQTNFHLPRPTKNYLLVVTWFSGPPYHDATLPFITAK